MNSKSLVWIILGVIVIVIGVATVDYMNKPDDRNAIQRVGDAAEELPNMEDAAGQLEDRSPAQKLGDEIEEATDGDGK